MSAQPVHSGSPLFQPSRNGRAGRTPRGPAGSRPHGARTKEALDYYRGDDWPMDGDQDGPDLSD